jgi:two-component system OmpR family response regulator
MQKKLLVIDDESALRENIVEILELENYICQAAIDGEDGLKKVYEFRPDLILCDIKMPKQDGYWLLDQIKNDKSLAHIPFVFITAKVETRDIRSGMDLGADDYLTKPFTREELLNSISARFRRMKALKNALAPDVNNSSDSSSYEQEVILERLKILTKAETEILYLVSLGFSSLEIAEKRFNSSKTIENHRANIIAKLGLVGNHSLLKFSMSIPPKLLKFNAE